MSRVEMSPEFPFPDPAAQGKLPDGEIDVAQIEAWMDRLVDGEVAEPERRTLLSRLERMPDGWRRCALAFLEAQAWREALDPVSVDPVSARASEGVTNNAALVDQATQTTDYHSPLTSHESPTT